MEKTNYSFHDIDRVGISFAVKLNSGTKCKIAHFTAKEIKMTFKQLGGC